MSFQHDFEDIIGWSVIGFVIGTRVMWRKTQAIEALARRTERDPNDLAKSVARQIRRDRLKSCALFGAIWAAIAFVLSAAIVFFFDHLTGS